MNAPDKIKTPFASSAGALKNSIPEEGTTSDIKASMQMGFPPRTMSIDIDRVPPAGQDVNGILYKITEALRFLQAGGHYAFDNNFCTAIGGYPLGAILMSADGTKLWQNQVAGNTNNPDLNPDGWKSMSDFLPLGGGTLTGNLFFPLGFINNDNVNNYFALWAGTGFTGAAISLGTQESTYAGAVMIQPANSVGGRASITRFENTGAITYANSEKNISRTAFSVLDAPCDSNTTLSLPASGGTINAPNDGYISLLINSTESGQFVRLDGDSTNVRQSCYATAASQNLCVTIRVKKGDTVTVRYTAAGTTQRFRFTKTVCADMM